MSKPFVHLHVHSEYSLLEASTRIAGIVEKAKEYDQPAVALTDNGNMFGAIDFYNECKKADINPIIGLDAYIAPKSRLIKGEDREGFNTKLVLLAQSLKGYQTLCKLSSIGFQEGFYYKPRIDYDVLTQYNEDLIALTGGLEGEVPKTFLRYGPEKALEKVRKLQGIFGDRLYLELNRTGRPEWEKINQFLAEASTITGVPLVCSNDVHFLKNDEAMAQEVLICIGSNRTLQDENRYKLGSDQFYFKDSEQMHRLFQDFPGAADRTVEVAERCKLKFKFKDEAGKPIYHLPSYPVEKGVTLLQEITRLSEVGLQKRIDEAKERNEPIREEDLPKYHDRLKFEISVIDRMGFSGYFLIVQDFIGWAKVHGIPVGPGRGSGAGSLVAYSLAITDLDPMRYNLIFERFLNPERISMPDFDVDFCQDRRPEVIDYVTKKYGSANVSQIITFGKLKAKAAIRDVGRVLGMTFAEVDVIAKLIPEKLGITLDGALKEEPKLQEIMDMDPKIATLMELALKIENLNRHASIHAAGVVISDKPLVELAPLYKGEGEENIIQYDMKVAEKIGLIKFDFLGLKTLTLIEHAFKLIKKNKGLDLSTKNIAMSDPKIYEIMSEGDTAGIFQFEGDGISDLIQRVKPTCFEDITAINALYRPGPMQMLDEYIDRKHGKTKITYVFQELEEILKETYGIIVYQEQVQLIAARIANYSLGEADMLRRAMGKKIASEMAQQRGRFLDGAAKNGFDKKKSEELFDLMAKFAEYGFNKSHAAAYCVVAAQTAWLKSYYPVEFYAATLSTEMADTDKVVEYIKDAQAHGIIVKSPDVNFSERMFAAGDNTIFFGLAAVKGVGGSAVEAILEAREQKPDKKFKDLEDFFTSVDLRRVNKKVIESLIKAGAFECFGYSRARVLAGYPRMIEGAESQRADAEVGQVSLFSLSEDVAEVKAELPEVPEWPKAQRLAHEKEVLGFYLSEHPLTGLDSLLKPLITCKMKELKGLTHKSRVRLGGLVATFREVITRKGTRMGFGQLEDLTGSVEMVVFPDAYAKFQLLLKEERPIVIEGTMEKENETPKIIVDAIYTLEQMTKKARKVIFRMADKDYSEEEVVQRLTQLRDICVKHPGQVPVGLEVQLHALKKKIALDIKEPAGVTPSHEFFENLEPLLEGLESVELRM
ncbi:MAG: DNA polymerase III subunit alpha [Bdellovibrionales bacterium]